MYRLGKLLLLMFAVLPNLAHAEYKILEVNQVYTDYMRYLYAREPFFLPGEIPTARLDLHVNMDLLGRVMFLNTMVHSETDQTQYRKVGLNYSLGAHLGSNIDIYYEHFSQHLLDAVPQSPNVYDAVGVRIYLYKRSN